MLIFSITQRRIDMENMKHKIEELNRYFSESIADCNRRCEELQADERKDEAVFEKIKLNVYGIFKTVLSVTAEQCASKPNEAYAFLTQRLDAIPSSWEAAYEKAKEHGNDTEAQIERIKLDTVAEIYIKVRQVWGEQ